MSIEVDPFEDEAIECAGRTAPAERLLEGLRVFDRTCVVMTAGIRHERPDATEDEVATILKQRLALARRLELRH
jgi:hypothetical protein